MSTNRIAELEKEIQQLKDAEAAKRRTKHVAYVETMTNGMSYDEMLELRKVLEERMTRQYAHDSDE